MSTPRSRYLHITMTDTTDTSEAAYRSIKDAGDDVILRKRVAAAVAIEPRTAQQLAIAFPERSDNTIRPRINELVRMGCVRREGTRETASGHDAYVHHVTERGRRYLDDDDPFEPEPDPTLASLKREVTRAARAVVAGEADIDVLHVAVERHDRMQRRVDPDWEPEHHLAAMADAGAGQ